MSLKLPPRFASIPACDLFGELPDGVFRTLAQLHGLAWQTRGEHTPPFSISEFCQIRRLEKSQVHEHLKLLKEGGFIRVEALGGWRYIVYPLRWEPGSSVTHGRVAYSSDDDGLDDLVDVNLPVCRKITPENRKFPRNRKVVVDVDNSNINNLKQHQQQDNNNLQSENRTVDLLRRLGIKEPMRSRLAALPHVEPAYLETWARWFEGQDEFGVGWVIVQVEAGEWPPEFEEDSGDEGAAIQAASDEDLATWVSVLERLKLKVTKANFDTWLRETQAAGWDDGKFVVMTRDKMTVDWLENRMQATIRRALGEVCGRTVEVRFVHG